MLLFDSMSQRILAVLLVPDCYSFSLPSHPLKVSCPRSAFQIFVFGPEWDQRMGRSHKAVQPNFWYLNILSLKLITPLHHSGHTTYTLLYYDKDNFSSLLITEYKRDTAFVSQWSHGPISFRKQRKQRQVSFSLLSHVFPLFLLLFQCEITPWSCKHRTQLLP